ncbi:protein PLASTID MOVEMENT IMPAIRED 2 [Punica granatum]|uniref:Uncharacterized protein n=2 Tax=Punica granatum TaxID=22663 RepID=A0A218VVA2_PUNGR|nr:protein PLASTID MOVEMENT IMPAIRED 2 [Punica granatum]OWM64415.1 hypothetical protein CDL15_Pgr020382 [Punica granatum]PKI56763.1 hypothetical protein CRG98_022824 [Punica granatum]
MGGREYGERNAGSVKAAIDVYGEKINLGHNPALEKRQMNSSEGSSSRAKELLLAKKDIDRCEDSRRTADSVKARAETELLEAKKTVKHLKSLIEESNSKAKLKTQDFEKLRRPARREGKSSIAGNSKRYRYEDVMRELDFVKRELSKLKLDVASVLEEKSRAEKEAEASNPKTGSYSGSVETLRKEIEEVNEEQMLVELARIEALKELNGIEAQRKKEASEYMAAMEETRRKITEVNEEIESARDIEATLAVTLSDVEVLQVGLSLARDMEKRKGNNTAAEDESEASPSLRSVMEELERAKKELASINEEGFQFMASMDVIRRELRHVIEETMTLKKNEEKVDMTVQNLNSKLLRAKSRLEAVSLAEEKANSTVLNLSATLEQLRTESEAAKKEKGLIEEETAKIKAEIEKTESGIDLTEEKLRAAMQELEEAKTSEALALEKLGALIERTVRDRASASQHSSHITISKFEYDYLIGRATGAEEIANKKVAAAQAWIEALKASEKEILMKSGIANREVWEMRVHEEQQVFRTERSLSAKKKVGGELKGRRMPGDVNSETEYLPLAVSRKSPRKVAGEKSYPSPARRVRVRKSGSPATRQTGRSASITLKRRKDVTPDISSFFSGKKIENQVQ